MAILAQGTEIFFIDPKTPTKIVKVTCPTNIDAGTPSVDEHDVTTLCSNSKEKFLGLTDWGSLTLTLQYDEADDSHWELELLAQELPKQNIQFVIGQPQPNKALDNQDQPSVLSGKFSLPNTRGWREFTGQVMSFSVPYNAGEVLVADVQITVVSREKPLRAGRT